MAVQDDFKTATIPQLDRERPGVRKAEFFRYYSDKRIQHQIKQLDMLRDVPAATLTEIGSYLGFATGLFLAAGFRVRTIDVGPVDALGQLRPEEHVSKNILDVEPEDLQGQDVIVCCETLEHLFVEDAKRVLGVFHLSEAEWLLVSVPYRCFSFDLRWVRSPFSSLRRLILKFPTKRGTTFTPQPGRGHKWELGYKGYPLRFFETLLGDAGYRIHAMDHVPAVQSVMVLCRRVPAQAAGA